MAKPSDLQAASLLEEIACAMQVGTPVIDSMRRLQNRRLGSITRSARKIAEGLDRGESVADAVEALGSQTTSQAAAAIRHAESKGNPELIERLAAQIRRRADMARESRLSWFYPIMLLVIGYLVAILVMAPLVRRLHGRDFQWAPWLVDLAFWLETNWWLPPAVAGAALVIGIAWIFTRDRFPKDARRSLFCDALADQVEHGVTEQDAVKLAAGLSGDSDLMSLSDPDLETSEVAEIISAGDMLPDVSSNVQQLLVARLRYKGAVFAERARRHRYFWSRLVPRFAMVVVGCGLTLSYVWWVIAPVYIQVAQW